MDGPLREGRLLLGLAQQVLLGDGRRVDRRSALGDSRFVGQTVPEKGASVRRPEEVVVDLPGDVTLQAAHDLWFSFAFFEASFDVGLGRQVVAHSGENDAPQGVVGLSVTAGVEPEPPVGLARPSRDRGGAAQMGPGCFGTQPVGMVACCDDQNGGDMRSGPVHLEQARGLQFDERQEQRVEVVDLGGQDSARRPSSRKAMRVA